MDTCQQSLPIFWSCGCAVIHFDVAHSLLTLSQPLSWLDWAIRVYIEYQSDPPVALCHLHRFLFNISGVIWQRFLRFDSLDYAHDVNDQTLWCRCCIWLESFILLLWDIFSSMAYCVSCDFCVFRSDPSTLNRAVGMVRISCFRRLPNSTERVLVKITSFASGTTFGGVYFCLLVDWVSLLELNWGTFCQANAE